jgi:hypothetical protein
LVSPPCRIDLLVRCGYSCIEGEWFFILCG